MKIATAKNNQEMANARRADDAAADLSITSLLYLSGKSTSKIEADWSVVLGEFKLGSRDRFEQHRRVKKLFIHPNNFRYWELGYNDIPDDYDIGLYNQECTSLSLDFCISAE